MRVREARVRADCRLGVCVLVCVAHRQRYLTKLSSEKVLSTYRSNKLVFPTPTSPIIPIFHLISLFVIVLLVCVSDVLCSRTVCVHVVDCVRGVEQIKENQKILILFIITTAAKTCQPNDRVHLSVLLFASLRHSSHLPHRQLSLFPPKNSQNLPCECHVPKNLLDLS